MPYQVRYSHRRCRLTCSHSPPVFFICFRECLETVIIVSILLAFIKQSIGPEQDRSLYKKLVKQVWFGVGAGLLICLIIGCGLIGAFYGVGKNFYANTEDLWEGIFGLIATIIISIVGAALLRVSKLQDKWRVKLANALEKQDLKHSSASGNRFKLWCERYAMFLLPFITVLREGLEAVVFIGGVGLGLPAESFPLAVLCGLGAGALIGYLIYRYVDASRCFSTNTDQPQWWQLRQASDLPYHLDMLLVLGRCW